MNKLTDWWKRLREEPPPEGVDEEQAPAPAPVGLLEDDPTIGDRPHEDDPTEGVA